MKNSIYYRPDLILQNMIRFNTTNPPGNEADCIKYIKNLLADLKIPVKILYKDVKRPNLFCRLKGQSSDNPLLLYGHVDVVTTTNQKWDIDPFKGIKKDGYIWGRGALDMKGPLAMMISAFCRAKIENITLPQDVILCILSDEENNSEYGAKYLTEKHKELFKNVKYAISEFGGFPFTLSKRNFYLIEIAQKGICRIKIDITGKSGHGSGLNIDSATAKLSRILSRLNKILLPVHVTQPVSIMLKEISNNLKFPLNFIISLFRYKTAATVLLKMFKKQFSFFQLVLRNIVNPTIIEASDKINVIPEKITVKMDGRILPGITCAEFKKEVASVVGKEAKIEIIENETSKENVDLKLFNTLKEILLESEKECIPVPFLLPATSDAIYFSKLGIHTYGFTPFKIEDGKNFLQLIHSGNEKISVDSLYFGSEAIFKLLQRMK
ncbi:MAG: M20/M25/M40 family metallo-hydrolase [Spirochaetes bacterium]|nr:M20/M25/M40 family metallo-hydrolase [Spirochaetota bacterium]